MEANMNAKELRKKIQELSSSKLENLSSSEIQKLYKTLDLAMLNLQTVDYDQRLEELFQVSLEKRGFYQYYWDICKIKKPGKKSTSIQKEKYLHEMKKYNTTISQKYNQYQKTLDRFYKISEEQAMEIISKMTPEEKKLISVLASLTLKTSRGPTYLSLSGSKSNNLIWLRELKNVKSLGVLSNPLEPINV
jgi:hypothetical protein